MLGIKRQSQPPSTTINHQCLPESTRYTRYPTTVSPSGAQWLRLAAVGSSLCRGSSRACHTHLHEVIAGRMVEGGAKLEDTMIFAAALLQE